MKIKCPGCATLLQIPDSAAGKVVKCKCGKQLRAPAAKGAAPAPANPANPAARSKPLPAAAPVASSGLFDELTDTDLAPVRSVQIPGAKAPIQPPSANASKMLQEAMNTGDRRAEGLTMKGETPRPPFLVFLGVINWLAAFFYFGLMFLFIGLVDMGVEAMEQQVPDGADLAGIVFYLIAGMMGIMAFLSAATGIACFMRGKFFWYVVLVSYGWALAFNLFEVLAEATSGEADMSIIKGVGSMLVGAAIWAWLHGESVRDYYQIKNEPLWRTIVIDATGFVVAGGLGAAIWLLR